MTPVFYPHHASADSNPVGVNEFVLVQGMSDTRSTLRRWNASPGPIVRAWATRAAAVALTTLLGVLVVSARAIPDPSPLWIPGLSGPVEFDDVAGILFRNSLVLALHAFACVAGFIAGASLPLQAERHTGLSRWVHEKARPIAMAWVVVVTCFSLVTQTYILGSEGSTLAGQLEISPGALVLSVAPHALPELVALFLPLAAWTLASRRNEWNQLLAATFATTAIAIPILLATASWEAYVWPEILQRVSPVA
jgi:hypothetical protein